MVVYLCQFLSIFVFPNLDLTFVMTTCKCQHAYNQQDRCVCALHYLLREILYDGFVLPDAMSFN